VSRPKMLIAGIQTGQPINKIELPTGSSSLGRIVGKQETGRPAPWAPIASEWPVTQAGIAL
jgi:hypothetical protein